MNRYAEKVPKRILSSLLSSVAAGVVPRAGAPYMAIGRGDEVTALLDDLMALHEGEGRMRFLIGRYGSGKSFLIQLIRGYALERDFLCADADLSPERRLNGAKGSGLATYRELMKNLASKTSPDGAALPKIIAKWLNTLQQELLAEGIAPESLEYASALRRKVYDSIKDLEFFVGGFDFTRVILAYYSAYIAGDDEKKSACLCWLRGEFSNKTQANSALGFRVSTLPDDENWYDFIKLWAALARKIGYGGLVVFIDECVNLYKIVNRVSRENNYEKILSMFNDTLQGKAPGLAVIFGGTPQFVEDTRRGLYSYEALRSRLCDSRFDLGTYKNLMNPVIRLSRLSDDELFALITRITALYAQYYEWTPPLGDEDKITFMKLCLQRAGADSMITPREMLRDYMTILNILFQNRSLTFADVMASFTLTESGGGEEEEKTEPSSVSIDDIEF